MNQMNKIKNSLYELLMLTLISAFTVALIFVPTLFFMPDARAETVNLVTGERFVADLRIDQRDGDVFFVGWYDDDLISYRESWFDFGLEPVETDTVQLTVDRSLPANTYHFLQFTTRRFADPEDIRNWQHVRVYDINVQQCTGFSPPLPGCSPGIY